MERIPVRKAEKETPGLGTLVGPHLDYGRGAAWLSLATTSRVHWSKRRHAKADEEAFTASEQPLSASGSSRLTTTVDDLVDSFRPPTSSSEPWAPVYDRLHDLGLA